MSQLKTNRAHLTCANLAWPAGRCPALAVQPIGETSTRYYLRFDVVDKPGVLAEIAGVLGREDISIASVLQHEQTRPGSVPLVITTHDAREANVASAIDAIQGFPSMAGPAVRIRMLQEKREAGA